MIDEPAPTRPFDGVDTEVLLGVAHRLGLAPAPESTGPSAPIPMVDDYLRAMVGALIAGAGERLIADHEITKDQAMEHGTSRARDDAGGWREPQERMAATISRLDLVHDATVDLATHIESTAPSGAALPVVLRTAAQVAEAAEHMVQAALAELYGGRAARDNAIAEGQASLVQAAERLRSHGLLGPEEHH